MRVSKDKVIIAFAAFDVLDVRLGTGQRGCGHVVLEVRKSHDGSSGPF